MLCISKADARFSNNPGSRRFICSWDGTFLGDAVAFPMAEGCCALPSAQLHPGAAPPGLLLRNFGFSALRQRVLTVL